MVRFAAVCPMLRRFGLVASAKSRPVPSGLKRAADDVSARSKSAPFCSSFPETGGQDLRDGTVIDVRNLATNEKCIKNLRNDFRSTFDPDVKTRLSRASNGCISNCSSLYSSGGLRHASGFNSELYNKPSVLYTPQKCSKSTKVHFRV
jgi:hypothetical protein